jgi:hypothetical protein
MAAALIATGIRPPQAALEVALATGSSLEALRAIQPFCAHRMELVWAGVDLLMGGAEVEGLASFLKEEGIHPASLRVALTDVHFLDSRDQADAIDLAVARLDAAIPMPAKFRLAAGDLDHQGQVSLQELPEGLVVDHLNLTAPLLEALPRGLEVAGDADLCGCTALVGLPEGLTIGGALNLGRCVGLVTLPDGLRVGGALTLRGCERWDGILPEDAFLGGTIDGDAYSLVTNAAAFRAAEVASADPRTSVFVRKLWDRAREEFGILHTAARLDRTAMVVPLRIATWALEGAASEPLEALAAVRALIRGRRLPAGYVPALRAAGLHPLSLALTEPDPAKAKVLLEGLGAGPMLGPAGILIAADGVVIRGWEPAGTPFVGDGELTLHLGAQVTFDPVRRSELPPLG